MRHCLIKQLHYRKLEKFHLCSEWSYTLQNPIAVVISISEELVRSEALSAVSHYEMRKLYLYTGQGALGTGFWDGLLSFLNQFLIHIIFAGVKDHNLQCTCELNTHCSKVDLMLCTFVLSSSWWIVFLLTVCSSLPHWHFCKTKLHNMQGQAPHMRYRLAKLWAYRMT